MSGLRIATATAGTSWLHRLSPVSKLAWLAAGVVVSLLTYDPGPLLAITALGLAAAASAGIIAQLGRALLAFAPLAASVLVIQALAPVACIPHCTVAATLGPMTFYEEGVVHGLSLVARLLALEVVAFTILLTTHPSDLFAGLERLHVPRSVAFAAAMTMQLVPILERELALVLAAQRARGLSARGPAALGRAVVPVVVAAVERMQQLSISLEARGLGASRRRTSYREVAFGPGDRAVALAGIALGIAGAAAAVAWWGPDSSAAITIPAWAVLAIIAVSLVVFVAVLVRAVVLVLRA